jgi:hypothetical protein
VAAKTAGETVSLLDTSRLYQIRRDLSRFHLSHIPGHHLAGPDIGHQVEVKLYTLKQKTRWFSGNHPTGDGGKSSVCSRGQGMERLVLVRRPFSSTDRLQSLISGQIQWHFWRARVRFYARHAPGAMVLAGLLYSYR